MREILAGKPRVSSVESFDGLDGGICKEENADVILAE